jgi:hypothetical protein
LALPYHNIFFILMLLIFFYRVHFSFPCQTCVQENVGYMRINADHFPCACPHYRVKCFSYLNPSKQDIIRKIPCQREKMVLKYNISK